MVTLMTRPKFNNLQIIDTIQAWFLSDQTEPLGRFFYNTRDNSGIPFDELTSLTDRHEAEHIIWTHYFSCNLLHPTLKVERREVDNSLDNYDDDDDLDDHQGNCPTSTKYTA